MIVMVVAYKSDSILVGVLKQDDNLSPCDTFFWTEVKRLHRHRGVLPVNKIVDSFVL